MKPAQPSKSRPVTGTAPQGPSRHLSLQEAAEREARLHPHPERPPYKSPRLPKIFSRLQFWFTIIGVLLVILGVVFLYRYSVEQGWITDTMRVAFGVALGVALLVPGLLLHAHQRFFSQMLMAAGIITFYISGYAAFQLYDLVSFTTAIAWMGGVTLLAFVLSIRQNEQVTSLAATIGGLSTPLMLHQGISSKAGVVLFIGAVLLGSGAVYLMKGWRLLLFVSFAGGWLSLLFVHNLFVPVEAGAKGTEKGAMQAGVAFALLMFWLLPLMREVLRVNNPSHWPQPALPVRKTHASLTWLFNHPVHGYSISAPFIALAFTRDIWSLENREWGWLVLGTAVAFGLAFLLLLRFRELRELTYVQALVGLALFTLAVGLILEGDARFLAYTAEALALHLVGWKLKDRVTIAIAHSFSLAIGALLAQRLIENPASGQAILNSAALSDLAFIAVAAGVSFIMSSREFRYAYQLAAYVALMGWFLRELSDLPNGQGYVTVAWGVSALVLLAGGIAQRESKWRLVALVTLLVVVAKLLLVDLAAVKAIWRVLLFVGFGALFLVLSHFFQSLWKPPSKAQGGSHAGAEGQASEPMKSDFTP